LTDWQIGILGLIALFVLIPLRMHISVAMGLIAFIGIAFLNNINSALGILAHTAFTNASSYMLAIIPMFMLMGEFANISGLIQEAYRTIHKWLGHLPGGLSMAAIGGCAAFAAVCGSSSATAVVMVSVSLPEMSKRNYWPGLALGSLGAGGTLGILIPPSSAFVLYGIITEQSIGKLFLAGIFPGILLTLLFWMSIYVVCKRNPALGPTAPKFRWGERLVALKDFWAVALLFGVVMGGIYFGIFTPTEAAGVGVVLAFVIALTRRRVSRKNLALSFMNALRTTGMVFAMIVGAMMFNYFLTISGLTQVLAEFVTGLQYSPIVIMLMILLLYLVLGCLMDPWAMLLIVVPIVFPIIMDLGFDPIWFGVVSVIMMEMGLITPPVGLNIFIIAGMAKDVPISTMYKGITPFVIALALCVVILLIFPKIALFLPIYLK
jgi:tripartite ATP-independent transporter DctM subunit